jgi:hypothetical protein
VASALWSARSCAAAHAPTQQRRRRPRPGSAPPVEVHAPPVYRFGDEHYNFARSMRDAHHVLLTLDE